MEANDPTRTDASTTPEGFSRRRAVALIVLAVGVLIALVLVSLFERRFIESNYLIIHSLAELFAVVVAWSIFALAWNSRKVLQNNYLLFVGIAYLFVGAIDLVHTLSYKGMGVFPGMADRANPSTQLWIAARYMESFSLLIAPLTFARRARPRLWLTLFAAMTIAALLSIFYRPVFPECYVEGAKQLTPFKVYSEYVICAVLLAGGGLLLLKRRRLNRMVLIWLLLSILITVAQELAFTLYGDVYGPMNLLGHYFKIVSFYLIYRAVIFTGLTQPQMLLFRELTQSEQSLQAARDGLEMRVRERTAQLRALVQSLQGEVRQRVEAEESLRESRIRLDEAQRIANLGNWDWDLVENTLWWSDETYRIFGLLPQQFGATYEAYLTYVHPDDVDLVNQAVRDSLASGNPADLTHRVVRPGGEVRFVHQRGEVTRDEDGRPIRIIGTMQDITGRRRLEEQVLDISELERQRIGQDLHDTVGQALTGAAYLSGALRDGLEQTDSDLTTDAARIERILNEATAQARAIARGLCPVQTEGHGLATALVELAADVKEVYEVDCTVESDDALQVGDPGVATHLYRITQEAVNNALKHARARRITIGLRSEGAGLRLAIHDDGVGLPDDHHAGDGIGLHIMRYRADMIGATLDLRPGDEGGTTVECILQTRPKSE